MLDTLSDSELRIALAAVEEHRQATSKAQREKELLDAGDWTAIEAYTKASNSYARAYAFVPWGTYRDGHLHGLQFWKNRLLFGYGEPHPMAPVIARGSRLRRVERYQSRIGYARDVWYRWAEITKLTWFPGDDDSHIPRHFHRVSYRGEIQSRPYQDSRIAYVWLRGKKVYLSPSQLEVIRQMYAVIDAFDNPRDRVKAMQAWKTERFAR